MPKEEFRDYYEILGVPSSASKEEIEEAFGEIVNNGNLNNIKAKAYDVLTDDEMRKSYNAEYAEFKMKSPASIINESGELNTAENYVESKIDFANFFVSNSSSDDASDDAQTIFEQTKEHFRELDIFVGEQLNNKDADLTSKGDAADEAEELYKRGMWPLLSKLKEMAGDGSFVYIAACEFHSRAILSLGDLCMWAERYERAIGMYNTALALSSKNEELNGRCQKAIAIAKIAFEEAKIKAGQVLLEDIRPTEEDPIYMSYLHIVLWVVMGFLFAMISLWGTVFILDSLFLH